MALSWLAVEESDTVATGRRRRRALLIVVGAVLVAAVVALAALLVPTRTPPPRPREVRSEVVSADGRFRATASLRSRMFTAFTDRIEVRLSRVDGPEVSLGCLDIVDEPTIELRFEADDSALTVDVGGETQRIQFDPQTLYPSAMIGPC